MKEALHIVGPGIDLSPLGGEPWINNFSSLVQRWSSEQLKQESALSSAMRMDCLWQPKP